MKRHKISSHLCQYEGKAWELHQPWTMTTHGSTPSSNRWVVPPIQKPWPLTDVNLSFSQMALHLAMNHECFIGAHWPFTVSKVKRGADLGIAMLEDKWCSRVEVALHGQVESMMLMSSPVSFVFVCGIWKFICILGHWQWCCA